MLWCEWNWSCLPAAHLSITGLSDTQDAKPLFACISQGLHVHAQFGKRTLSLGVLLVTPLVSKCFYQSWDYVCPVCVRREIWHVTQGRRNKLVQWWSQWLLGFPPFYLENTSHLPLSSLTAPLTQMCHQLHAESEECCLKLLSLYTGRFIVPISLPAPQEFRCVITEEDTLLMMVANCQHHMMLLSSVCHETENAAAWNACFIHLQPRSFDSWTNQRK